MSCRAACAEPGCEASTSTPARDYSHRNSWAFARLAELSRVFAIDLCACAVLSNHYHLVLRVDQDRGRRLTAEEVVELWTRLFSRPVLVERWQQGLCEEAERTVREAMISEWRTRLCDVSWYMRCLNEHLARRSNAEDQCKGRFWGRLMLPAKPAFATSM
jgi:hypothetical protein